MQLPQTIYVCPSDSCRFHAMEPGKCRSHPYPLRAMGPELVPLEVVAKADCLDAVESAVNALVLPEPINVLLMGVSRENQTPEELPDTHVAAREEAKARWGTDENLLCLDVACEVWLNTTGREVANCEGT